MARINSGSAVFIGMPQGVRAYYRGSWRKSERIPGRDQAQVRHLLDDAAATQQFILNTGKRTITVRRINVTPIGVRLGRRPLLAAAALAALGRRTLITPAHAAETMVRWLHLEVNPQILKIWNDAAAVFFTDTAATE